MRFARGDMRDHIVSCKNDHGASYRHHGVLQWWSRLKINVCEIFGVVRFSTFATISAKSRQASVHSITSSARASSVGGTLRPSALAVFMLITSSNLDGRSTGRSAGLVPFKMRSTKYAARPNNPG